MSMHEVAQHLSAMGRGNDSMLMHVTPKEVAGLDSLARNMGGQITFNPQTGLPEAGFFDFLTDYVVPIGLSIWNPYVGAAYSGAKSYAETGDLGLAALSAGTSYLGGEFGKTAGAVGTPGVEAAKAGTIQGAQQVAGEAVGEALEKGAQQGIRIAANAGDELSSGIASRMALDQAGQATASSALEGLKYVPGQAIGTGFKAAASQVAPQVGGALQSALGPIGAGAAPMTAQQASQAVAQRYAALPLSDKFSAMGQGIKESIQDPSKFIAAAGGPKEAALQAGSVGIQGLMGLEQLMTETPKPPEDKYDPYATLNLSGPSRLNLEKDTGLRLYAEGGIASLMDLPDDYSRTQLSRDGYGMSSFEPQNQQDATNVRLVEDVAPRYYARGGYLDGPGDGMSDSIPATIEGKQPARLADGEFVVPADVVSHLGNGSTKAGAKKLYQMLDRVRTARTGHKKQGKQINPNKFMPA